MLSKIKYFAIASIVFSGIVYALLVPTAVLAASPAFSQSSHPVTNLSAAGPSGVNVPTGSNFDGKCQEKDLDKTNCGIVAYLLTGINVLSALVGVIVVIMIAVGGMQYSMARDNPQAVVAARGRIINALLGLLAYLFMYALLQYLVPGGVL